jgi:AcrR family transcriptional regulator
VDNRVDRPELVSTRLVKTEPVSADVAADRRDPAPTHCLEVLLGIREFGAKSVECIIGQDLALRAPCCGGSAPVAHDQHERAIWSSTQQAFDERGANEPSGPGDCDSSSRQLLCDHGTCLAGLYHSVDTSANKSSVAPVTTRLRILEASLDLFGSRGVDGVSLDEIAGVVGVRKQSILYWFGSKSELVDAVLDHAANELIAVIDAAIRAGGSDPLDRIEAVVGAVFRPVVRRPALLGLIREVGRLDEDHVSHLQSRILPLIADFRAYLEAEMSRGSLRRADPGLLTAMIYATVMGVGTEPAVLDAVGWPATPAGLRSLRAELRSFLRAALSPAHG